MKLSIRQINTKKNLLAFSGGVDSTALFFTLMEYRIPFDIAIVNYNLREQAKLEVEYAKELVAKYDKKIFIKEVELNNSSNFEKKARDIRYNFFDKIIEDNGYETLITAHQLNDRLEWFFMQLSRGAGVLELLSFEEISTYDKYNIIRPLLDTSRDEIEKYLKEKGIKYFIDQSNSDEKYRRNYFRHNFSNKFLKEFKQGVKRSFDYLQKDINSLNIHSEPIFKNKKLEIFKSKKDDNLDIRVIDLSLKRRGFILTKSQRDEILKQKELVISHKISISISDNFIFIAPFENSSMPKEFKEKCRLKKIPKNIRSYIFKEGIEDIFKIV